MNDRFNNNNANNNNPITTNPRITVEDIMEDEDLFTGGTATYGSNKPINNNSNSSFKPSNNTIIHQKIRRKRTIANKFLHWMIQCFNTSNILLFLFLIQGIFAISCSFLLLYTTGNYIVRQHQDYQNLEIQSFIHNEMDEFIKSISTMAENIKNTMYTNIYFNLNLPLNWLKLFESSNLVHKDLVANLFLFCAYDTLVVVRSLETYRFFNPKTKTFYYYNTPFFNYDTIDGFYNSSWINRTEYNSTFKCTTRPWSKPYFIDAIYNDIYWSELYANKEGEFGLTIAIPIYINEKTSNLPQYTTLNSSVFIRPIDPVNVYPEKRNINYLFGTIAVQISLDRIKRIIQDSNRLENAEAIYIIDNKYNTVIANYTKTLDNKGNGVKTLALQILSERSTQNICNEYMKNQTAININPLVNAHHTNFKISTFNADYGAYSYFVAHNTLCDTYGLNWDVLIISKQVNLFEIIITTQYPSVVAFIVVFLVVFFVLFILVKAISNTMYKISNIMTDLIKLRGIFNLEEEKEMKKSIFYDIRQMENVLLILSKSMRAFSKFIPEIILRNILTFKQNSINNYNHPNMVNQEMTILFIKIKNLNLISEIYKDFTFSKEVFNSISHIIKEQGGVISQYLFDERVICYFNEISLPNEYHEINACYSALDILSVFKVLSNNFKEKYPTIEKDIILQIGIHTGNVFCGNLGSETRFNFTAIGKEVNLCSKFLYLNSKFKTSVLLSEKTFEKVKENFIGYFTEFIRHDNQLTAIYSLECPRREANDLQKKIYFDLEYIKQCLLDKRIDNALVACNKILNFTDLVNAKHLRDRLRDFNKNDEEIAFQCENDLF
ncbi:hypothetical protein ABK040_013387 [Willaertia magna]